MNADSVNRWLTLCANLGVLIGLILLVVELDQNSNLVRAQIHQARSDAHVANRMAIADTEYLLPAMDKYMSAGGFDNLAALDELTTTELARVKEWFTAYHQDFDNLFFQYQQGYLDEEFYHYRVEVPIASVAHIWKKLDIFETSGRRASFDAEIKRIVSGN